MPAPTVTPLPMPYPNRATMNAATYVAASDARMAAEQGFGEDIQAVGEYVGEKAADIAAFFDGAGFISDGTGPVTIGTGSKSLVVDPGLQLAVGMNLIVADEAAPTVNWLFGQVDFYDIATGDLDIIVPAGGAFGSGSHTALKVSLSGPRGLAGPALFYPSARSSNTMLGVGDTGKVIDATGTFTQTFDAPATLAAGWCNFFNNRGTGVHTLALTTTEVLNPGESGMVTCDGATLKLIRLASDLGPHLIVQDQKASGTGGGAQTVSGYEIRTLNTVVRNICGAALASSQVTLPPGTWRLSAFAAYGDDNVARLTRIKVQNITDGSVASLGAGHYAIAAFGGFSVADGVVTITAPKAFELQHFNTANADPNTRGFPVSSGDVEIYAQLTATRLF